jgi:hypothetical protein
MLMKRTKTSGVTDVYGGSGEKLGIEQRAAVTRK